MPKGEKLPILLLGLKADLAENERAVSENAAMRYKSELEPRCVHFEEVTTFTDDPT